MIRAAIALAAALLLAATPAAAQIAPPSCWVVSGATGYVMGATAAGRYAAWWCPAGIGRWSRVILVMRTDYTLKHPVIPPGAGAASVAEAYWRANVTFNCTVPGSNDPALLELCDAAYNASLDTMPAWRVATNGTFVDRPAFRVSAAGVRSLSSTGRATVGAPCDCTAIRIIEGRSTYCQTAPSMVAICTNP